MTIQAGQTIFNVPSDSFIELANTLCQHMRFEDLILVRAHKQADLVVLEGHVRLTAYALAPETTPAELTVMLGTAPAFTEWGLYGSRSHHQPDHD